MPLSSDLREMTVRLAAAFIANQPIMREQIGGLLRDIYSDIRSLGADDAPTGWGERVNVLEHPTQEITTSPVDRPIPAVDPSHSVFPDHIICLEDGKQFKSLKRHLMTHYNMTPEQYRARWNLPADYPMVAPSYAAARSELAKKFQLGVKRRREEQAEADDKEAAPVEAVAAPETEASKKPVGKPSSRRMKGKADASTKANANTKAEAKDKAAKLVETV